MASRQLAESAGWEEDPSYGGLFIISAILVGVVCRTVLAGVRHRFNLPYTVLVLLMGVVYASVAHNFNLLAMSHSMNLWVNINPHHLLYLLFPALIFGFAFNISFHTFVREAPAILMLAVPGVLLATLFTAVIVQRMFNFGWDFTTCMAFGAMLSATDPVSVVAVLKEMNVAPRLSHIIEGESLLNDGTAMVVFIVFKDAMAAHAPVEVGEFLSTLFRLSLGGVAWGVFVGFLTVWALSHIAHDKTAELTVTIAAAYTTFTVAEVMPHGYTVSGVLALVAAGLVLSSTEGKASITRISFVEKFWHSAEYLANTIIFFISGAVIIVQFDHVPGRDWVALLALYCVLHLVRGSVTIAAWVVLNMLGVSGNYTGSEGIMIGFAGLRGAVGLTLAMSVLGEESIDKAIRDQFMFFMSGIALLTLVVNGTTAIYVVRCYGMASKPGGLRRATIRIVSREVAKLIRKLRSVPRLRVDWVVVKDHTKVMFEALVDTTRGEASASEVGGQAPLALLGMIHTSTKNRDTMSPEAGFEGTASSTPVLRSSDLAPLPGVGGVGLSDSDSPARDTVGDAKADAFPGAKAAAGVGSVAATGTVHRVQSEPDNRAPPAPWSKKPRPPPEIAPGDRGFSEMHEAGFDERGSSRGLISERVPGSARVRFRRSRSDGSSEHDGSPVHRGSAPSWLRVAPAPLQPPAAAPAPASALGVAGKSGRSRASASSRAAGAQEELRPHALPPRVAKTSTNGSGGSGVRRSSLRHSSSGVLVRIHSDSLSARPSMHTMTATKSRNSMRSTHSRTSMNSGSNDSQVEHTHRRGSSYAYGPFVSAKIHSPDPDEGDNEDGGYDDDVMAVHEGMRCMLSHGLVVTVEDMAEARLEFVSLVRAEFWASHQNGHLSRLALAALLLACDRAEDRIRGDMEQGRDSPLQLWSDFDSKPKALMCLPHSCVYRSGEVLRWPCGRTVCKRSRMLVYGSLVYQHEAAAGLTHVLSNALRRFRLYAARALHPNITQAISADVQADIHASRVYVDDIENNFPKLVTSLTTRNIIRQIFVCAQHTLGELKTKGHLSEAEFDVMERAIIAAERPVRVADMKVGAALDPASLLKGDWANFLLRGLDDDTARRVRRAAQARVFTREDIIFEAGSVSDGFYILVKGRVALQPTLDVDELCMRVRRRSSVVGPTATAPETSDLFGRTEKVDLSPGDVFGAFSFLSGKFNCFTASCETSVYTLYFPRSAIWADIRSHADPVSMDKIPQPLERNVVCRAASVVARIMPELEQIPVAQLRKKLDSAGRLYRPCPSKQQPPLLAESLLLTGSLIHPKRSASEEDEMDSNGGSRGGTPLPLLVPAATAQSQFVENYQELQLQQESAARASLRASFIDGVHAWALLEFDSGEARYYGPGTRVLEVHGLHRLHVDAHRVVESTFKSDQIVLGERRKVEQHDLLERSGATLRNRRVFTTADGNVVPLGTDGHRRASFGVTQVPVESAARRMMMRRHANSARHLQLRRSRSAKTPNDHSRAAPRRIVSFATPQPHPSRLPPPIIPFHAASDDVVLRLGGGAVMEVDTPVSVATAGSGSGSVSGAEVVDVHQYAAGDVVPGRAAAVAAHGPPPFTVAAHSGKPAVATPQDAGSAPPPPPPDVDAPPPPPDATSDEAAATDATSDEAAATDATSDEAAATGGAGAANGSAGAVTVDVTA